MIRDAGGTVAGVAAVVNRGNVRAEDVGGVPELHAVLDTPLRTFQPEQCPYCRAGEYDDMTIVTPSDRIRQSAPSPDPYDSDDVPTAEIPAKVISSNPPTT
jgi:hypothetical protein